MKMSKSEFAAVITAAGNSSRMNTDKNSAIKKEYLPFPHKKNKSVTVLSECLFKFLSADLFKTIIITVPEGDLQKAETLIFSDSRIRELLSKNNTALIFTEGGLSRRQSVFNALLRLKSCKYVLIHDGARPWISTALITEICKAVQKYGAVVPGYQAIDTQKIAGDSGEITAHLPRSNVFSVQTPQGFIFEKLLKAHSAAAETGKEYTDDSEIYSDFAEPVFICKGEPSNKKITFKGDLECERD